METQDVFFISKLQAELARRKRKNAQYSLRSFAKQLDINSATLSSILKQKRSLPLKQAEHIADKLTLSPIEREKFVSSTYYRRLRLSNILNQSAPKDQGELLNEQDHFEIISQWEHSALLSLAQTDDFQSDHVWIAKRMGISIEIVQATIERLLRTKMITIENGKIKVLSKRAQSSKDIPSNALRLAHNENFELAKKALEDLSPNERYAGMSTVAINPENLPALKDMMREFRAKIVAMTEGESKKEVFRLSMQLFPLTKKIESINSKEKLND